MELRTDLRMARPRLHLPERAEAARGVRATGTPRCATRVPGIRVADPKACQCGEVLKGVIKPWECKVFGTACTPDHPIGTCMVSSEGACAAYYNYGRHAGRRRRDTRPRPDGTGHGARAGRSEAEVLDRDRGAPPPAPSQLLDEQITLSHGAGGKASHDLIEALVPARSWATRYWSRSPTVPSSPTATGRSPSPPTRSLCARCSSPAATSASSR